MNGLKELIHSSRIPHKYPINSLLVYVIHSIYEYGEKVNKSTFVTMQGDGTSKTVRGTHPIPHSRVTTYVILL